MSPIAKVDRIQPEQVDPAYCVISLFAGGLSLDEWRAFCAPIAGRQKATAGEDEIFVATNARGHVKGLCVGSVGQHPLHGNIFDAWFFCALSMVDEVCVACDLLSRLKQLARSEDCQGIRLRTLGQEVLNQCLRRQEAASPDPTIVMLLEPEAPLPERWHR